MKRRLPPRRTYARRASCALVAAIAAASCAGPECDEHDWTPIKGEVQRLAERDLRCRQREPIEVTRVLGTRSFIAQGCEREATYACTWHTERCRDDVDRCVRQR